jgi:archaemetzincin
MKYPFRIVLCFVLLTSCQPQSPQAQLEENMERIDDLRRLDTQLSKPKPGEWLSTFDEPGQSFETYRSHSPVRPTSEKRKIYLQPIGSFTSVQQQILEYTAHYVEAFFGLETVLFPALPDSIIPPEAKRNNEFGDQQLQSLYIMDSVLVKRIPADGIVLMALTAKDLYPGKQWNYVFGQADLKKRVGVSSLYRLCDWPLNNNNYPLCLRRLMKTASHEIGHMFSVRHCIQAECLMNGSNHLAESDERPTHLCADCLRKLYWNWQFDLVDRNQQLLDFLETHRLPEEAGYYHRAKKYLEN